MEPAAVPASCCVYDDHRTAAAVRHGLHWGKLSEHHHVPSSRSWGVAIVAAEDIAVVDSDSDEDSDETDEQGVQRKPAAATCKICANSSTVQHVPLPLAPAWSPNAGLLRCLVEVQRARAALAAATAAEAAAGVPTKKTTAS